MASARQLFRQSGPDIAALLGKARSRRARLGRHAAMGDSGNIRLDEPGPPADAFHDPHAAPHDRGYGIA